jgi:hypothetical protein
LILRGDPRIGQDRRENLRAKERYIQEIVGPLPRHQAGEVPPLPGLQRRGAHQAHEVEDGRVREIAEEADLHRGD